MLARWWMYPTSCAFRAAETNKFDISQSTVVVLVSEFRRRQHTQCMSIRRDSTSVAGPSGNFVLDVALAAQVIKLGQA